MPEDFLQPYILQIKELLKSESGQFMIVGMDKDIINKLVTKISQEHEYSTTIVKKQKYEDPENKFFILSLENKLSIEYQSLLYYYLELPVMHKCFVCFVTTSSQALNFFEKRVRSRFKNRIFFIPYCNMQKYSIDSTLESQEQKILMEKYNLEKYSLDFIFDLFEPTHFVLLIIAFYHKLNIQKCYEQFKMAVVDTPEIKKVAASKVMTHMFDLIETGVINLNGMPLVDFNEFRAFIDRRCPQYLKRLLKSNRIKK